MTIPQTIKLKQKLIIFLAFVFASAAITALSNTAHVKYIYDYTQHSKPWFDLFCQTMVKEVKWSQSCKAENLDIVECFQRFMEFKKNNGHIVEWVEATSGKKFSSLNDIEQVDYCLNYHQWNASYLFTDHNPRESHKHLLHTGLTPSEISQTTILVNFIALLAGSLISFLIGFSV